jgi:NADPH:quinone reductase-like Zn-dependent oxidoreductase
MANDHTMQAIRFHDYGGPDKLVMEQVPMPEPGPGVVLVRVHAAGVNPVDWKIRAGWMREFRPIPLPSGTGRDFAGTIEAVGPGVSGFSKGQAVYGMASTGSYAQYALASVNDIALKPERLSFDEAASVPIGGVTAWRALFDAAKLTAGQQILVQGAAGGVGLFAVQLASWKGAHVTGTASGANQEFVRSLGAEKVIDYQKTQVSDAVHDMDVVLDCVGGDVLAQSYQLARRGGILVTIAGRPDDNMAQPRGIRATSVGPASEAAGFLRQLGDLLQSGEIKPYVGKVLLLDQAAQAQALSETGHGRGHIVLHVAD